MDVASVTVVIATRNRVDELCRTVGQLTKLPERPPVIVVDNASDDGTPAALRARHPEVTVITLARNQGASARNAGAALASTPYVAFSDDDSWWEPGSLSRAVAALDQHPGLGLIAARTLVDSSREPDPLNPVMRQSPLPGEDLPGPRVLGFLAGASVFRRSAFLAAGGFSDMLFIGGEEDLLAMDLATAGWTAVYLDDVSACHWPSVIRDDAGRRSLLARNEVITAWLRRPARVAWPATVALVRQARHDPIARRALLSLIRLLPLALARRRVVPPGLEEQLQLLGQQRAEWSVAIEAGSGGSRVPGRPMSSGPAARAPRPTTGHRVSVVIITRDRRPELVRTLDRMTALPGQPPVIVVDNASSDGSAAAAGRYRGVQVVRAPSNLGAVARNIAVERVDTPYVAFCDDDTWWEPSAPGRAADLLDGHPALASVTGRILVEPGGHEDPITPELRDSPVPGPPWLPGPALLSILAGASMLRVNAFRQAGGFSRRLWLGGEEELLALDLAAAGWWMCWCPEVVVHHAASAVRDPRERRMLGIRNTLWTAWLRRPLPGAARHTAAVLGSVPRDWPSAVAVAQAAWGLPWVLRERRVIPASVEAGLRLLEAPRRSSQARRYVG